MKLEEIGFYTLSDDRARNASTTSRLMRCEIVLGAACNFRCPYCRRVGGEKFMPLQDVYDLIDQWARDGLYAIRFSGGEPTLHPDLRWMAYYARRKGIERIAVSTNGSRSLRVYEDLLEAGVNDVSVSLDACCAEDGDRMAGGVKGAWKKVIASIKHLSRRAYVTVGVVLTDDNARSVGGTVALADELDVSDIRVIPAAQNTDTLRHVSVPPNVLAKYPILRYRIENMRRGRRVRGLGVDDARRCALVLDDMAVNQGFHYPCIIYMREGGQPIGKVGPEMRQAREEWFQRTCTIDDPICRANCLDVCADYNNRYKEFQAECPPYRHGGSLV